MDRIRPLPRGFFISFEGVEGAGKSTQARLLAEALSGRGYAVLPTREPGGTPVGEELRRLLTEAAPDRSLCPETELLLMCASRAQLLRDVIRPFLARGGIVVCDRFADSTTAYQGYARGLDLEVIRALHRLTVGDRWPDLTFILDLEPGAGLDRIRTRAGAAGRDRFEAEAPAFHQAVRAGFLAVAAAEPGRVRVLSAAPPAAELHRHILECVTDALG